MKIGCSTSGKPIYVLAISNMKTRAAIDFLIPLRNRRNKVNPDGVYNSVKGGSGP